jgi:hypothetical protein
MSSHLPLIRLLAWALCACLALTGCAGFRSGEESAAYVDGQESGERGELRLDDISLAVRLNNQIQQNDFQVILFVVPVMYDPFDKPRYAEDDPTRLVLDIRPATADYRFRPEEVVLTVDGRPLGPERVSLIVVHDPGQFPLEGMQAIAQPPTGLDYRLAVPQRTWQFELIFKGPVPKPSSDVRLDLSRALVRPGGAPLPVIRFKARAWSQGYT